MPKIIRLSIDDAPYLIRRSPSVFTERNNDLHQLDDVRVMRASSLSGELDQETGLRFRTIAVFAAESGMLLRATGPLPDELNPSRMREMGLID